MILDILLKNWSKNEKRGSRIGAKGMNDEKK